MKPKKDWEKRLSKQLGQATSNVEQMKYDIMNWATGTDEENKKKFNLFYYGSFSLLFLICWYFNIQILMIVVGFMLGASLVGWIYANVKGYFKG
jgi:hypothetical protein